MSSVLLESRFSGEQRDDIILIPREVIVANLLLRDLDDEVLQRLKAAAKAHRRSLQAEVHDVLAQASARSLDETRRLSARWLKRLRGRAQSDSVVLIREDRDR
jgi:antitoxin FitA